MHSDFKGFVAITLSIVTSREAMVTGIADDMGTLSRAALLVMSLGWMAYGLWHVFGANKEK
jgi:hypothetical protein